MKYKLGHIFAFVIIINNAMAQDIHFSQYYAAPLNLNPAMTGALYDLQINLNYKDQWRSVINPYKTFAASIDKRLTSRKNAPSYLALGINFFNDKVGSTGLTSTNGNLNIAYHAKTGLYSSFGGGIQLGFGQRSVTQNSFQTGSQYDGVKYNSTLNTGETNVANSIFYFDSGAGLVWTYDNTSSKNNVVDNKELKFTLGGAVSHINQPQYSFYKSSEKLHMKYTFHGSGRIGIPNSKLAIVPSFIYNLQGSTQEIIAGTMLRFKFNQDSKYTSLKNGTAFSIGAHYRVKDALILAALLEYTNYAAYSD